MIEIARFYSQPVVVVATSTANTVTPRIPFGRASGGGVLIANTNGATQISWYAASGPETTPLQVYADGAAVTTAVTTGAMPVPDACFGFPFLAPVIVGSTSCSLTFTVKG